MSTQDLFELPPERLTTNDEQGRRVDVHPADYSGKFKNRRLYLQILLMAFFLLMPWIRIDGQQAILLDIPQRRFALFGITFWSHDAPMVFFIFAGVAVALLLATTLWGRIWCGWACPQTVFIEMVFRRIERWIEGNDRARRKLALSKWNAEKLFKRSLKWFLFLLASLVITHSFLAYFVGAENMLHMILKSPSENWTSFVVIVFTTLLVLFDFGWFREQFCIIVCPYGRLQGVLMDSHSMTVLYDPTRGEPRKVIAEPRKPHGDCVNCFRCVQVCPTGIDIRRGVQLECIGCTACMDACDAVMKKFNKPSGLIRYESEAGLEKQPHKFFRARSVFYSAILAILAIGFVITMAKREPLEITFLRAKETPYQVVPDIKGNDFILNHFKLSISNMTFEEQIVDFNVTEDWQKQSVEVIAPVKPIKATAGKTIRADLFIKFPKSLLNTGHQNMRFYLDSKLKSGPLYHKEQEITVVGPF